MAGGAGTAGGFSSPGAGNSRPLLSRIEGMADRISRGGLPAAPRPTTLSTVYDPYQMAALQKSVEDLTAIVHSLEQRLAAIESKIGVSPAAEGPGAADAGTATTGPSSLPANP
jgi:hypothetical protein